MSLEKFRTEDYVEGFKKGFVQGFRESFETGFREGYKIGFKEGYDIGLRKVIKKFVFNLLKRKQSDDFIIQTAEITKDQLVEFKKEYAQKQ